MTLSDMRGAWLAIAIAMAGTTGCGDDASDNVAGMSAGASGMSGGAGGMSGGAGGTSGAGGMGGGGSGGTAGDGNPAAPAGCDAAMEGAPADLHMAAAAVLTAQGKCSFEGTCHSKTTQSAGLILLNAMDVNALLVDKPSCVAPDLPLVKSGGGEAALQGSWLWLKLVAPADDSGILIDDGAWGAPTGTCNQGAGEPRGVRMPWGSSDPASEDRLAAIRNWICAGAPGPT